MVQYSDDQDSSRTDKPIAVGPEEAARAWHRQQGGGQQPTHDPRGNRDGLLYRFGATNANPESQAFKQLDKLRDRIESILNNVAASIGGRVSKNAKHESVVQYDDFFEKGHKEEYQLGQTTLLIEVKFTIPGSLKLVIRNPMAERSDTVNEEPVFRGQQSSNRLSLDELVGLQYNPTRHSLGNSYGNTVLPGNEHFMSAVFMPVVMFSDANNLAFYVQGMCADRLTYVFLDQDL